MQITELTVKNVKGVKSISFTPTQVNRIGGDNGQGKSSLLDAIILTLKQKSLGKFTERIIREGESVATTEITFDDGNKVFSRWHDNGRRELTLSNKTEGNVSSPQKTIDNLIGELTFDPLRFHNQTKEEQVNTLLEMCGGSLSTLNSLKEQRRNEKREYDRLKKLVASMYNSQFDEELKPVDIGHLVEMSERATNIRNTRKEHEDKISRATDEISTLRKKILDLEADIDNSTKILENLHIDDTDYTEKLKTAQSHNNLCNEYSKYLELATSEKEQAEKVNNLEREIARVRAENRQKIAELNLLDGLDVDDETGSLTVNGIPIKQLSSAEQMMLAVKLAMQTNTNCKILILQNASLLDKKSLRQIMDICSESGWQLFIETVGVGDIVISEGKMLDEQSAEKYRKEYTEQ